MLRDQGKGGGLVFLKPHPSYPDIKDISMMKGREPQPLMECNGFCGVNDLVKKNDTEHELNYSVDNRINYFFVYAIFATCHLRKHNLMHLQTLLHWVQRR